MVVNYPSMSSVDRIYACVSFLLSVLNPAHNNLINAETVQVKLVALAHLRLGDLPGAEAKS